MRSKNINMIEGSLFPKLIVFSIPLILSGVLQLLFNAADIVVVGKFSGDHALAAVGSTSSLINLLINLFIGVSIGASVLLGRYIGSKDYENASDTVHTSILLSIIFGILMVFVGIFFSKPLLEMMDTPQEVIGLSTLYMRIYFLGMPAFMVYNYGSALLRAVGDTKTPLVFLSISGVINVILNLILVIVFKMSVDGVAIATIISQYISATLIIISLIKSDDVLHFDYHKMHFHKDKVKEMLKIGIPSGVQGMMFSISNVLIQSSVNSFGPIVMAGNTASSNIEGFVYTAMNSIYQTALSFTAQNMGAKKYDRVDKILVQCLLIVTVIGLVLGIGAYSFGDILLALYTNDPNVIVYGLNRMSIICVFYCLCGIMDVLCGSIRGMGYAIIPMFTSLVGSCLLRIVWIYTVFAMFHTQLSLYISYPVSWLLTALVNLMVFLVLRRKIRKGLNEQKA